MTRNEESGTIRDAGSPGVLAGTTLAGEFCYWSGASGRRYLTRAMPLEAAGEFPGAPVVLTALDDSGRREAVWIGIAGGPAFEAAIGAARAVGAVEAHLHLVSPGTAVRHAVVCDLRAAVPPGNGRAH